MERPDLILLVLIGLSVFIGLHRGLSDEILRLVVYVLSCVSGYALIPVFQPFFSSVPGEAEQRSLAVFSGTIAVWFVLRIMASFLTRKIKKSSFRELDRSLGAVFGGLRAGIVLLLLNLIFGLFAPHIVQSSRILTLSSKGTGYLFHSFPELGIFDPKKTETANTQDMNWKKRLLYYLQNTTLGEGEEKTTLLSYLSLKAAKEISQKIHEEDSIKPEAQKDIVLSAERGEDMDVEKQKTALSPEVLEENTARMFEMRLTAWLKDEPLKQNEMQEMADKLKERMLRNENFGD